MSNFQYLFIVGNAGCCDEFQIKDYSLELHWSLDDYKKGKKVYPFPYCNSIKIWFIQSSSSAIYILLERDQ